MRVHRYTVLAIAVAAIFLAGLLAGLLASHHGSARCHQWPDGSATCRYDQP